MKKFLIFLLMCLLVLRFGSVVAGNNLMERVANKLDDIICNIQITSSGEQAASNEGETSQMEMYNLLVMPRLSDSAFSIGEFAADEGDENLSAIKIDIRNDSSSEIDVDYLMREKPILRLLEGSPQVLIIHTHGSEAYTPAIGEEYEESDPYRTEDKAHNVIKVGDVLAQVLEAKGIRVIHDRELYDSPSYTGSYTRSGEATEKYLKKYPSISVVIDLHRDAIGSGDMAYKTKAEPSLGSCAQIMLLVGTGDNGLYHPHWQENMRLALYIQQAMEQRYPSLARPLAVKSERYNQHLSCGAMIVEVGTNGNTLAEAITAISYFGDAAGDVLKSLTVYE